MKIIGYWHTCEEVTGNKKGQCVHMKLIRNKKKQSAIKSMWNTLSDYMREEGGKGNKKWNYLAN